MKKISKEKLAKLKAAGAKVSTPPVYKARAPGPLDDVIYPIPNDARHTSMRDVKAVWSSRPKPKAAPPPEEPTAAPDQLLNDFLSVMTMALRSFNSEAKLKPDLKVIDGGQSDVGPIPQPHVEYAIDTEKLPNGLINQLFLTDTSGSLSGTKAYQFQRNEFGLVESITGEDKTLEILRDANGQLSGIQHV